MGTNATKRVVKIDDAKIRYSEYGNNQLFLHLVETREPMVDEEGEQILDEFGNPLESTNVEFLISCTESALAAEFNAMSHGVLRYTVPLIDLLNVVKSTVELDLDHQGQER